jgi:hypothetical protein
MDRAADLRPYRFVSRRQRLRRKRTEMHSYLTISGRPYCQYTGCMAGLDLSKAAGVDQCSYRTVKAGKAAAKALRAHTSAKVCVVVGTCPDVDA